LQVLCRQVPVLHVLPEQHGWPVAPHAAQLEVPPRPTERQTRVVVSAHVLPLQHGCPCLPQATHEYDPPGVAAWQRLPPLQVPAVNVVPPQHGWLGSPQATHFNCWQVVVAAVQRLPEQQESPRAPHTPQAPSEQVPTRGLAQVFPEAVQVPFPVAAETTQQPPSAQ
jgi:hypothetical protein